MWGSYNILLHFVVVPLHPLDTRTTVDPLNNAAIERIFLSMHRCSVRVLEIAVVGFVVRIGILAGVRRIMGAHGRIAAIAAR